MGYQNREIEYKFKLTGMNYDYILKCLKEAQFLKNTDIISGSSADFYWKAPVGSTGDFVRLRRRGSEAILTMKATDKKDISDRIEIDVNIDDYNQGMTLMHGLFGEPEGSVHKRFDVFFFENEHTNLALYQIESNIFIEAEALSFARVNQLSESLLDHLFFFSVIDYKHDDQESLEKVFTDIYLVKSSVYDMFIKKQDPVLEKVTPFTFSNCTEKKFLLRKNNI